MPAASPLPGCRRQTSLCGATATGAWRTTMPPPSPTPRTRRYVDRWCPGATDRCNASKSPDGWLVECVPTRSNALCTHFSPCCGLPPYSGQRGGTMAPRGKPKRKDVSMKRTLTSAAAAAFCFSFLLGDIARAQEEKTPASEETTWTVVRVVETARPETATFKGLFWPPIVTREKAPEGYRWLVVVAELKPPEPKAKLKVSAVHLVDNSSKEHTVFALSYYKEH